MMSPVERSALADLAARLRRVPLHCARGGHPLVEWLADEAKAVETMVRVAGGAGPKPPRSPQATAAPETRFTEGTVVIARPGKRPMVVRAERRARRAA